MIVAGPAARVPIEVIRDAKAGSGHLSNLFCRYSDYLLAQIMQSVACNSFHSIEQRAARWLLTAQDRAGDRLELTQEALAGLLGVQRTTVNAAARQLTDERLIATRRGTISIENRAALEARACACYDRIERFFGDIVGTSGRGRPQSTSRQPNRDPAPNGTTPPIAAGTSSPPRSSVIRSSLSGSP